MVGAISRVSFDYSPIDRVGSIDSVASGNDYQVSIYDFQNSVSNVGSTSSVSGSLGDDSLDDDFSLGYDPYAESGSGNTPLQFA